MLPVLFAAALIPLPATSSPPSTLTARITDPAAIRAAVKEAVAASDAPPPGAKGNVLGSDGRSGMTRAFDEARVPDCLHPDALKHQPAAIGPIGIGGIYALPFWLSAVVRGKCN